MSTYNKQQFADAYVTGVRQLMDIYDQLVALGVISDDLSYTDGNSGPGTNAITDEDMASVPLNTTAAELYSAMAVLSNIKAGMASGGRAVLNALRK